MEGPIWIKETRNSTSYSLQNMQSQILRWQKRYSQQGVRLKIAKSERIKKNRPYADQAFCNVNWSNAKDWEVPDSYRF